MSEEKKKSAGGKARAKNLTPERRSEIARMGAIAKSLPKVTHKGILKIAEVEIPCFVLDDGRRVITGRGLTAAIGMKGRGQGVARITGHRMLTYNENSDLAMAIENPIKFIGGSPKVGVPSDGFEATVLQELCEAILVANDNKILTTPQEERYLAFANMLIRAFARVGIVALVDEVTGYQEIRPRDALQAYLDKIISKELAAWAKNFLMNFTKIFINFADGHGLV